MGMNNGAMNGASAGSAFGPYGAIFGAIGGGFSGLMDGLNEQNDKMIAHHNNVDARNTLGKAKEVIDQAYTDNQGYNQAAYDYANSIWNPNGTAVQDYQTALDNLNNLEGYKATQFAYDKNISDFYDPAFQLSVNNANNAINSSQAAAGNMFSSDTMNKLAAKNQVLATQMYNDARNAYAQDKSLEQSIWSGNENARQAEANNASNLANSKLTAYGNVLGNVAAANQNYYNNLMNMTSNQASDNVNILGAKANLKANDSMSSNVWLNALDVFGSLF